MPFYGRSRLPRNCPAKLVLGYFLPFLSFPDLIGESMLDSPVKPGNDSEERVKPGNDSEERVKPGNDSEERVKPGNDIPF
jgi:hypothetical protein